MTRRMVAAIASPHVDVLGHCTGRLLVGRGRPQSEFDADVVIEACRVFDTALEINCRPERLDPPQGDAAQGGRRGRQDRDQHRRARAPTTRVAALRHRPRRRVRGEGRTGRQRVERRRPPRVVRRRTRPELHADRHGHRQSQRRPISQWWPNGSATRPMRQPYAVGDRVDLGRAGARARARTRRRGRRPTGSCVPAGVSLAPGLDGGIGLDPEVGAADPELRDLEHRRRRRRGVRCRPRRTRPCRSASAAAGVADTARSSRRDRLRRCISRATRSRLPTARGAARRRRVRRRGRGSSRCGSRPGRRRRRRPASSDRLHATTVRSPRRHTHTSSFGAGQRAVGAVAQLGQRVAQADEIAGQRQRRARDRGAGRRRCSAA